MAVIKSVEEKYMKEALKQAKKAYALGEVPIGCVIICSYDLSCILCIYNNSWLGLLQRTLS